MKRVILLEVSVLSIGDVLFDALGIGPEPSGSASRRRVPVRKMLALYVYAALPHRWVHIDDRASVHHPCVLPSKATLEQSSCVGNTGAATAALRLEVEHSGGNNSTHVKQWQGVWGNQDKVPPSMACIPSY